jgi:hypothetical protein
MNVELTLEEARDIEEFFFTLKTIFESHGWNTKEITKHQRFLWKKICEVNREIINETNDLF